MAKTNTAETPFSEGFLKKIEGILNTQKEELEAKICRIRENLSDQEEQKEEDDVVRELETMTVDKQALEATEKNLRDVLKALERIDNGSYGICKYTGEPIDEKRLLARPTSTSSVNAKKFLTGEA